MLQKRTLKIVLILACIFVIVLGAFFLYNNSKDNAPFNNMEESQLIEFEGKKYEKKENMETILLMGLDKYEDSKKEGAYVNDQQSDLMMLITIDYDKKTCNLLHINRDTMTEIERLGVTGDVADRFIGQICLAHTYGSGGSDSNINARNAVEGLFGDLIDINHYISMTMDGVAILNDSIGGVTVNITDDMTTADSSFVQGSTVTLGGEQALKYVRARGSLEDDSNLARMERQKQYMEGFINGLKNSIEGNPNFLSESMLKISNYLESNITANGFDELGNTLKNFEIEPIETLKGEAKQGKKYIEFYADKTEIKRFIISKLYKMVK